MRKNPRFLFWFVVVLTIVAVIINLPAQIPVPFGKNKTVPGFSGDISLGPIQLRRDFSFRKGLDLQGGTSITLTAYMKDIPKDKQKDALESAKEVIERRVNFFGVSESVVQTATVNGDSRIIVELPGVSDLNQAIALIGTTAKLTFWEEGASGSAKIATPSGLPLGIEQVIQNPKKTNLSGADLSQTSVSFDPNSGKPQVQLVFTSEGTKKFADITKRNVNKIVPIALDNQIVEAPRVNEPILNGNAVISGAFTTEQAKQLSIQLNAGALPVSLSVLEQRSIGPTLGEESLAKSLFAGILGFVVIVIFMCVLYGRLGIIASIALILYALFVLALFRLIPVTLTLAGIAGFILSIGMAVDANILIFERMREELRAGKSKSAALELGFSRAWTSIRDSNIASLITSVILFMFGTSIVRGFALTLGLGVLVSMFSAIWVTRTILRLVYR